MCALWRRRELATLEQLPEDSIIIKPESGDTLVAEDVLKELCDVLRKRGYALIHRADAIILIKVLDPVAMQGRAVAYVQDLTPLYMRHKPIDWSGDFSKKAVS